MSFIIIERKRNNYYIIYIPTIPYIFKLNPKGEGGRGKGEIFV